MHSTLVSFSPARLVTAAKPNGRPSNSTMEKFDKIVTSPPQAVTSPDPIQPGAVNAAVNDKLPDSHPCSRGHSFDSKFTGCGIAWAVCCFPWGLICLLNDRKKYCVKCGMKFDKDEVIV